MHNGVIENFREIKQQLAPLGVDIQFVVPQLYGVERAPHMRLVSPALRPRGAPVTPSGEPIRQTGADYEVIGIEPGAIDVEPSVERRDGMFVQTVRFPALLSPYLSPEEYRTWARGPGTRRLFMMSNVYLIVVMVLLVL